MWVGGENKREREGIERKRERGREGREGKREGGVWRVAESGEGR